MQTLLFTTIENKLFKLLTQIILIFLIFIGCSVKEKKSSNEKKSFTAVVEISAGTNKKYEYNYSKESFEVEIINGKERVINYLPYPGNYGFITNTYMDPKIGGDGDALDVLIISESIAQGSEVKINPIGILKLLDGGEEDHKVIAIPKDSKMNFIKDSLTHSIKTIIQTWFCNYKGPNKTKYISWGNRNEAIDEIRKWSLNK